MCHSRIEVMHNCSAFLCQFLFWEKDGENLRENKKHIILNPRTTSLWPIRCISKGGDSHGKKCNYPNFSTTFCHCARYSIWLNFFLTTNYLYLFFKTMFQTKILSWEGSSRFWQLVLLFYRILLISNNSYQLCLLC